MPHSRITIGQVGIPTAELFTDCRGRGRPRLHFLFFQEFFYFQRGHAAAACGRDRLSIAAILHIAACIDSGNSGEDVVRRLQIAILIHIELALEHLRVGNVSNAQKQRAGRKIPDFVGLEISQAQARDFLLVAVVYVFHDGIEKKRNFFVMLGAFQHDLGRTKVLAAMNHRDLGGETSQENRLFHGRIAAADHHDFLARKKETVAGSAGRNTVSDELLLMRQSQPARRSATGNDQRASMNDFVADMQLELVFG